MNQKVSMTLNGLMTVVNLVLKAGRRNEGMTQPMDRVTISDQEASLLLKDFFDFIKSADVTMIQEYISKPFLC